MYSGGTLGCRFDDDDPNQLRGASRERTAEEQGLIKGLAEREEDMRIFLMSIPNDADRRGVATALTKLDELVLWAKRAIDK